MLITFRRGKSREKFGVTSTEVLETLDDQWRTIDNIAEIYRVQYGELSSENVSAILQALGNLVLYGAVEVRQMYGGE